MIAEYQSGSNECSHIKPLHKLDKPRVIVNLLLFFFTSIYKCQKKANFAFRLCCAGPDGLSIPPGLVSFLCRYQLLGTYPQPYSPVLDLVRLTLFSYSTGASQL